MNSSRKRLLLKRMMLILITIACTALAQAQDSPPIFPIMPGSVEGNISAAQPGTRYSFQVNADQPVSISMSATSGDLDPFLFLFDEDEQLIDSNDDFEAGRRDARISFTPAEAGRFIIEATRFEQEVGSSTGSYRLTLQVGESLNDESGTGVINAPPFGVPYQLLDFEQFATGSLDEASPLRYFALNGQQGDFVRFVLTRTSGDVSASMALRSSDLNVISRSAEAAADEIVIYATLTEAGWTLLEINRELGSGSFTVYATRLAQTTISFGETVRGDWSSGANTISYIFNATIGDRVFGTLTSLQPDSNPPTLVIYDLNQNELARRQASVDQARVRGVIPRSGPYILEVSGGSGPFDLSVRRVPLDISKLDAEAASYNRPYKGRINASNPVDYYRFSGKAGELVTVAMQSSDNSGLDPYVILADAQLNELVFSDALSSARSVRITQYALPADGDYFILATRDGLAEGRSAGDYDLELTVGQIALTNGAVTATLNWQGNADLKLFMRGPDGRITSWANPAPAIGPRLQIESNSNCQSPTAQPVEHIYWPGVEAPMGDYTIWVWYQNTCGSAAPVPFSLRIVADGEELISMAADALPGLQLNQRFEVSFRLGDFGASLLNPGSVSTPSPQQRASQGGDMLIQFGQSLNGTLSDEVYALFYQFVGQQGDVIRIQAQRVTGTLDPVLVLRGADERNLAVNDDAGQTQDSLIIYELPADGPYTIAVTRFGLRDGTSIGDFRLTLERES